MDLNLQWHMGLNFTSSVRGHEIEMDANYSVGGSNRGPTPKELVLAGLAGCSGMDAIAYLKKHNSHPLDFNIKTQAEQTKTTPQYFATIHLVYQFIGAELDLEMVVKSVETSMTRYCGVSYMLNKTTPITYDIELNGKKIFSGEAHFSL